MNKLTPILLGFVLTGIALWLLLTSLANVRLLVDHLEAFNYDLQLRANVLQRSAPALAPVAIVDIDDKSLQAEGHWPWPRNKLAALTNELQKQGAAFIAFDIFFPEKEDN